MVFTEDFKIINGCPSHQLCIDGGHNVKNILKGGLIYDIKPNQLLELC